MHISWHFDEIKRVTFYSVPVAPALEPKVIVMSASRKRKRKVKNEKTKTKGTGHHPLELLATLVAPGRSLPWRHNPAAHLLLTEKKGVQTETAKVEC